MLYFVFLSVYAMCFFLAVWKVGLCYVIVAFPSYRHLFLCMF